MPQTEWTPEEAAALDAAFAVGVREAISRGKALYMQLTHLPLPGLPLPGGNPRPVWTALYPPRHIRADEVAEWCDHIGIRPGDSDLFFPHTHVLKAAQDLGIAS